MTSVFKKSVVEAIKCFLLGVRETSKPRSIITSVLLWLTVSIVMLILFFVFRKELLNLAMATVTLVLIAWAVLFPGSMSGSVGVVGGGLGAATAIVAGLALGWILVIALYYLCVIIIARVLSELFLMRIIRAQALESYTDLTAEISENPTIRSSPALRKWTATWGLLCISPLTLLVPFLGVAIFSILLSYLNARFFVDEAISGLTDKAVAANISKDLRIELICIGIMSSILSIIPFAGVFSPWATGSAVCHLTYRQLNFNLGKS